MALVAASCTGGGQVEDVPVFTPATGGESLANPSTTLIAPEPTEPPQIERPKLADYEIPCGISAEPVEAESIGVAETTISIATGSDEGAEFVGQSGARLTDAVIAMAEFCNASGGLAGRTLAVSADDAVLTEVEAIAQRQCGQVLAVIGAGYLDQTVGDPVWDACGMPRFAGWPESVMIPGDPELVFAAVTAGIDEPTAVVVGSDTEFGQQRSALMSDALTEAGIEVTAVRTYLTDEATNWGSVANAVSADDVVYLTGSCRGAVVPLLEAGVSAGVTVVAGPSAYDLACLVEAQQAGVDLSALRVELPFLPFEDLEDAPITAALAEVLRSYALPVTGDTLLASAAFWDFAQVSAQCAAEELNRACLVDTQGELEAELGLVNDAVERGCRVLLRVGEGGFARVAPTVPGQMLCPETADG